jgi:hypothetical protein
MGQQGASCFNTISDNSRDIEKDEWDKERFGMLCTKAESFANWKQAILKLCKLAGKRCKYDVKKKIIKFNDKVIDFSNTAESYAIDELDFNKK